jgi:hypothetical protein
LAPNTPKPREKLPAAEKLAKPEAVPNPPKADEEHPPEKVAKPEATPNSPKAEEKRPAEKLVRPELAPNTPKIQGNRPAIEHPARPEQPANAAQRAIEQPLAPAERRPAPIERKPEAKECGRPGFPPCPR